MQKTYIFSKNFAFFLKKCTFSGQPGLSRVSCLPCKGLIPDLGLFGPIWAYLTKPIGNGPIAIGPMDVINRIGVGVDSSMVWRQLKMLSPFIGTLGSYSRLCP